MITTLSISKFFLIAMFIYGFSSYGFYFAYTTFPAFQRIRKFVMEKIHEKLGICVFCISFWFTLLSLLFVLHYITGFAFVFDPVYYFIVFVVSLGSATISYVIDHVVEFLYKKSRDV